MCSRMTTIDGRSPGSRVSAGRRLPGISSNPSGVMAHGSPLTVAGAAAALDYSFTAFPFDPRKEPSNLDPIGRLRATSIGGIKRLRSEPLTRRPVSRTDGYGPMVPLRRGLIGNAGGDEVRQDRGCPRNCTWIAERQFSHWPCPTEGITGKAANGGDPQARKPASGPGLTRRAGCPDAVRSRRPLLY
jgi:hypothetical protein